ncbi:MAG: FHA domain-containing protein [Paracoccaceae bacterium]
MKLFSGIFGRSDRASDMETAKRRFPLDEVDPERPTSVDPYDTAQNEALADHHMELTGRGAAVDPYQQPEPNLMNIWDIEDDEDAYESAYGEVAAAVAAQDSAPERSRRNRTRLLGFDTSEGGVVDLFDDSETARPHTGVQFPVGWLLVVKGPGRGHCFTLTAGMAQIGRGEDQTIQLDFGDTAISRDNHAAVVFDPETNTFLLGHGGKSNIVRLNGKPVISNETLSNGDNIGIGETVLQLKTLVDDTFSWADTADEKEGDDDLAIA